MLTAHYFKIFSVIHQLYGKTGKTKIVYVNSDEMTAFLVIW